MRPQSDNKSSADGASTSPYSQQAEKDATRHDAPIVSSTTTGDRSSMSGTDVAENQTRSKQPETESSTILPASGDSTAENDGDNATESKASTNESEKAKDPEDDWEKVSVPSIPAETQYKAAPIPTVNVWQTRMASQAAKLKEITVQNKNSVPEPTSQAKGQKPRPAGDEHRRKSGSKDFGSEGNYKLSDTAKGGPRKETQSGPLGRSTVPISGDNGASAPLTVNDTRSWPTPDSSITEDRRKSSSIDRSEKTDGKPASQKPHVNKWVQVPFVPTAKFETQLPPSASRGRGRGAARGRDGVSRGGAHALPPQETPDSAPGAMGPPPPPRQSVEHDRGRKAEEQRSARGASVPTSSSHPEGHDASSMSARKVSAAKGREQMSSEQTADMLSAKPVDEVAVPTADSSRSSSRHTGKKGARQGNAERTASNENTSPAYAMPTALAAPVYGERSKGPLASITRPNGESARERGSGRREFSRDKPESAREKVESWRDREPSGDQNGRRGGRGERGRGGYRGRGDHNYNPTYSSTHPYSSPLPQNGFDIPSRSSSHNEPRSRQTSQPFVSPPSTSNTRTTNPRSQSIPVGMMYYNGMTAAPQGLSGIQTDMSAYGYASQMQMQPSIMSAMPYNDPLNSYALLSMVMTQM
jgi:la-related protein 1